MAKLLVLLALACFAVVSVSCSRGTLKRAAARFHAKRQTREAKQCCLPSKFSASATLLAVSQYGRYKTESAVNIEAAYSQANNALYWKASNEEGKSLSSLVEISSDKISLKFAVGSCTYQNYLTFTDSYFVNYIQDKVCLPAEMSNYIGDETFNGKTVEVYDIYKVNVTIFGARVDSYGTDIKLRAIRQEDGSCFPVQVEAKSNSGMYDSKTSIELQSLEISDNVDTSKFEAACTDASE